MSKTIKRAFASGILSLVIFGALCQRVCSFTPISGAVSGIWTSNESPYVIMADANVPTNQLLSIHPGTEIVIGPDVRMIVDGGILAAGNPANPIVFRGANPSNYWYSIQLDSSPFTNSFTYCRMSEARYDALSLTVNGGGQVMFADVENCEFSNCINGAIYGSATGLGGNATLNLQIRNCVFENTGYGITIRSDFIGATRGYANATVAENVFNHLTGAGFSMNVGSPGTYSSAVSFINNTVVGAQIGIEAPTPFFDAAIENNIFVGTSNAVRRPGSGSTSLNVSYNCFYSNTVNFSGYPGIYGLPVTSNHNGDPCDGFFNILQNPGFIDEKLFLLSNHSPCIDAGDPAISDVCPNISKGTDISDLGAYGGPNACNWPTQAFAPTIVRQPQSEASCVDLAVQFCVDAKGAEPLIYQWYFDGAIFLDGKTNRVLDLVNLQTNEAGIYSVVVSNAFGETRTESARLLVFDPCFSIRSYAGLSVTGVVGRTYCVQYETNLSEENWITPATNTLATPYWFFLDPDAPPSRARRFYRVIPKQ